MRRERLGLRVLLGRALLITRCVLRVLVRQIFLLAVDVQLIGLLSRLKLRRLFFLLLESSLAPLPLLLFLLALNAL